MHTHEKMKTCSPQSDSAADDSINTFTWLTDSTHCWPAVPLVNRFTRYPSGLWQTKAPYVTKDYTPLTFGMLFFCEVMLLLVEERNILSPFLDTLDKWQSPLLEVTVQKNVFVFGNYCANDAYRRDTFKITGQHKNGFTWPFTVTLWNMLDTFV
jgi:hypothetical protein